MLFEDISNFLAFTSCSDYLSYTA